VSARRTPAPSTRMTTSCARELIAFARRIRVISAADLVRRARCSAERRYEVDWRAVAGRGGARGTARSVGARGRGRRWSMRRRVRKQTSWCAGRRDVVRLTRGVEGRRRDGPHQVSRLCFGMKSVVIGSPDVADEAVKSRRDDGTEQPVR
jgi:hypothetical protein